MGNEYEALTAAVAMIDAAVAALEDADIEDDAASILHGIRNDLNAERVALLGNGAERPWHVSEIVNAAS